jgi:hypothetical protein
MLADVDLDGLVPSGHSAGWPKKRTTDVELNSASDGSLPSEKEEVVAAKSAPVGLKEPVKSLLDRISHTYASKLD